MPRLTSSPHALTCPTCGSQECHPTDEGKTLIRGYKVDNYSQCLVCSGGYDSNLVWNKDNHDSNKGWFLDNMTAEEMARANP